MPERVTITVRRDDLNAVLDMAKDWSDSLADAAQPESWDTKGKPNASTMRLVRHQRTSIARILVARHAADARGETP